VKKGTVKIRGIRSPIPSGHLIGRTDTGEGDGHLVKAGRALTLGNKRLDVTLSGDVEIDQKGEATVVGLQGRPIDDAAPSTNDVLTWDGSAWAPAVGGSGSGDVVGPAGATDGHFAQYDGPTGLLIKDGGYSPASFDAAGAAAAALVTAEAYTDTAIAVLDGGTTGQVLTKDSNTDLDFSWQTSAGGYTDEMAQDAVGAMVDSTIVYVDATPLLTRAALTGDVTAPQASNVTTLGSNFKIGGVGATFGDTAGAVLTAGSVVYFTCPFAGTIAGWNITVDGGTCTFDIWKIASGTAIPTVSNTITASALPAISTGTAIHSTTLTAWTTSVAANDIFGIQLKTVATAKYAELDIQINRT
jgi:hypothetical protein